MLAHLELDPTLHYCNLLNHYIITNQDQLFPNQIYFNLIHIKFLIIFKFDLYLNKILDLTNYNFPSKISSNFLQGNFLSHQLYFLILEFFI